MNNINPNMRLRLVGSDANYSNWQVFLNDAEITKDIVGVMIEMNRGCLPLITLQCVATLRLPKQFMALVEAPERLYEA